MIEPVAPHLRAAGPSFLTVRAMTASTPTTHLIHLPAFAAHLAEVRRAPSTDAGAAALRARIEDGIPPSDGGNRALGTRDLQKNGSEGVLRAKAR